MKHKSGNGRGNSRDDIAVDQKLRVDNNFLITPVRIDHRNGTVGEK